MLWFCLIALLNEKVAWAETCEEHLESRFKQDLVPRMKTYEDDGIGFDYFEKYPECLSDKGIYVTVIWLKTIFPLGSYGFCLPSDCDMNEGQKILDSLSLKHQLSEKFSSNKVLIKCLDLSKTEPMLKVSYFFIICFLILLLFEVLGTFYSLLKNQDHFLNDFSILKNFKSLFSYSKSSDNLEALNGIRSIASLSIIFHHSYIFSNCFATSNHIDLINLITSSPFSVHLIIMMSYSVDIFFILSGFLMSVLTIQELRVKGNDFSWTRHFARRLLRIWPILYFLVGFDRTFYGATPKSHHLMTSLVAFSDSNMPWWSSLVFTNNLYMVDQGWHLGWAWSTSADFQFYLLCSLILIAYHKNKSNGYALAAFYVICSMACITYFGMTYNCNISNQQLMLNLDIAQFIYTRPYSRISTFIVGVVLGFIYLKATQKKSKVSLAYSEKDSWGEQFENFWVKIVNREKWRGFLYFVGLAFVGFSIVGPHYYNVYGQDSLGIIGNTVWLVFQRLIFALGISFLIFPMLLGHLKRVRNFLEMRIFKFLADISYSMYIIHPVLFFLVFVNGNEMVVFELKNVFWVFLGLYGTSILVSIILKVLIETPFLNLSRNYLSR